MDGHPVDTLPAMLVISCLRIISLLLQAKLQSRASDAYVPWGNICCSSSSSNIITSGRISSESTSERTSVAMSPSAEGRGSGEEGKRGKRGAYLRQRRVTLGTGVANGLNEYP